MKQSSVTQDPASVVKELLKLPANQTCADCCTARNPRWASLTGCFICIQCAGIHRGLGTHISTVRSVTLDSWKSEHLNNFQPSVLGHRAGNLNHAAIYEARLHPEFERPPTMEQFIADKYRRKLWYMQERKAPRADPTLHILLLGIADPKSALAPLRPYRSSILRLIYEMVHDAYTRNVKTITSFKSYNESEPYFQMPVIRGVKWPERTGIHVNMMPFVLGDKRTLPQNLHSYWPLIRQCATGIETRSRDSGVFYLTVDETSWIAAGETQRRFGLHIECPGSMEVNGVRLRKLAWGGGWGAATTGGLFMGSSVEASCEISDCSIIDASEVIAPGPHASVEHMRHLFPDPVPCEHDVIYWITDKTPHSPLPMKIGGPRTFFRLVSSPVNVWFSKTSTWNPLCPVPDGVTIVDLDKFPPGEPTELSN